MSKQNKENNLTDLTKISGPGSLVLSFNDLQINAFWSVVGPADVILSMRHRLLDIGNGRDEVLRIFTAPWFPAGTSERHEMAFRALKNRLWAMSEARFEETLLTLEAIKKWKSLRPSPDQVTLHQLRQVKNLGSFYDLFYPGIKSSLG